MEASLLLGLLLVAICASAASSKSKEWAYLAYNEGLWHHRNGQDGVALLYYEAAVLFHEDFPEAHQNLAILAEHLGRSEQAMRHHRASVLYSKSDDFKAASLSNYAQYLMRTTLHGRDRAAYAELLSELLHANEASPDHTSLLMTLGVVYNEAGDVEASISYLRKVTEIDSCHAMAHLNIGNHYFRYDRLDFAVRHFRRALECVKANDLHNKVMILNNLGQSYREGGRNDLSLSSFYEGIEALSDYISLERLLEGKFALNDMENIYIWSHMNAMSMHGISCDWGRRYELIEVLIERWVKSSWDKYGDQKRKGSSAKVPALIDPYTYSLFRFASATSDRMTCQSTCAELAPSMFDDMHEQHTQGRDDVALADWMPQASRPLRVGYLSYDWRNHPMGRLTARLVTRHNASRVDTTALSYGKDDKSSIRRLVEKEAPVFVDLVNIRNDHEASAVIDQQNLDVLVDITTHTYNGRIGISAIRKSSQGRPPPIVINYLGFPGTTGCVSFDYTMVDSRSAPPESSAALFSEKLIYLPYSYQANALPLEVGPCVVHSLCRARMKFAEAISQQQISALYAPERQWICSFNQNKKMEPQSFSVWMSVLRRVPSSVLLLLDVEASVRRRLRTLAASFGVAAERLQFLPRLPWPEHLQRAAACDIILDTFVYGAHTTSSDMLWMWVPVLSLESWASGRMPSRVAASITQSVNMPSPGEGEDAGALAADASLLVVVHSQREFEDAAVRMCENYLVLRRLREIIGRRSLAGPTFDYHLMQSVAEHAYFAATEIRRRSAGRHAAHIVVAPHPQNPVASASASQSLRQDAIALYHSARSGEEDNSIDVDVLLNRILASQPYVFAPEAASLATVNSSSRSDQAYEAMKNLVAKVAKEKSSQVAKVVKSSQQLHTQRAPCSDQCRHYDAAAMVVSMSQEDWGTVDAFITCAEVCRDPHIATSAMSALIDVMHFLGQRGLRDKEDELFQRATTKLFRQLDPVEHGADTFSSVLDFSRRLEHDPGLQAQASHDVPDELDTYSFCSRLYLNITSIIGIAAVPFRLSEPMSRFADGNGDDVNDGGQAAVCGSPARSFLADAATFLSNRAVTLSRSPARADALLAVKLLASALAIDPAVERLQNLGIAMQNTLVSSEAAYRNKAHMMAAIALLAKHDHGHEAATAAGEGGGNQITYGRGREDEVVVFYCNEFGNAWWGSWGPSSLLPGGRGLGGSEEAVVYLADELAALGYAVEVYADPPIGDISRREEMQKDGARGAVYWFHHSTYDTRRQVGAFVAWRYSASLIMGHQAQRRFLWLHDLVDRSSLPPLLATFAQGILVQSDFHKYRILSEAADGEAEYDNFPMVVFPNGVADNGVEPDVVGSSLERTSNATASGIGIGKANDRNVFVYASAPNRGLENVLRMWGVIKAALPAAIVRVYYGFSETVESQLRKQMGNSRYEEWRARMDALLNQDGVKYVGAVNHSELRAALRSAGFILYPTTFQETGCITVMKAMQAGCVPITSRLYDSVLRNLTAPFDLGPQVGLHSSVQRDASARDAWLRDQWVPAVIAAASADETQMQSLRVAMMQHARETFSWSSTAKIFTQQLQH